MTAPIYTMRVSDVLWHQDAFFKNFGSYPYADAMIAYAQRVIPSPPFGVGPRLRKILRASEWGIMLEVSRVTEEANIMLVSTDILFASKPVAAKWRLYHPDDMVVERVITDHASTHIVKLLGGA